MRTLIAHFYNEEYLLPFWIKHHRDVFDNAILINYKSTDNSVSLIKKLAPTSWRVVDSINKNFNANLCDLEVMEYEKTVKEWKIILNVTEFIFCPNLELIEQECEKKDLNGFKCSGVVMVDNQDDFKINPNISLVDQKRFGFLESAFDFKNTQNPSWYLGPSRNRIYHNCKTGLYLTGRHESLLKNIPSTVGSAYIMWYGFSPWSPQFLKRKVQIQKKIDLIDFQNGLGLQHAMGYYDLNKIKNFFLTQSFDLNKILEKSKLKKSTYLSDLSKNEVLLDKTIDTNYQIFTKRDNQIPNHANKIIVLYGLYQKLLIIRHRLRVSVLLRFDLLLLRYDLPLKMNIRQLTRALRKFYHCLPLPVSVKKLVRFFYYYNYPESITTRNNSTSFNAPAIRPLAQQHDKPDYILWGVIDWYFRHQRPQHLALNLSASGRRIFYISAILVNDNRAGFEVEKLDASGRLFNIKLFIKGSISIYEDIPNLETVTQLRRSIGKVLEWADIKQIVSLVNHPFWYETASVLPNSRLVYDCLDYHKGFNNYSEFLVRLEKQLLSDAQLTISTSSWLDEANTPYAKHRALIPNGCEYEHFAKVPDSIYRDSQGRRVIGYFGAIADWFDLDLVEFVARQHKDCSVLLIGTVNVDARSRLSKLYNVTLKDEVPYSLLPHYLHGFDVCLLPFKVIPLTLATNPVKIYEYLCSGKPVVAVNLPEIAQFKELVYSADSKDDFSAAVNNVLSQPEPETLTQKRKAFAAGQTWQHRVKALIQNAESAERDSKVSVIVVTYNNIELNRLCLESLDKYSQYDPMEIIVVDNASNDGTQAFLSEWVTNGKNRKLILNEDNRGFAAANNQGLAIANGDYLVMLNNDTHVTPGWVRTLVRHLERDKTIGLIGPVTNNVGNEAKIDIVYDGMNQMQLKSSAYTRRHIGKTYPLKTAAFFCVMMPRTTFELVGTLDEAFGLGFFEDDDYCRRIEQHGLRIVCAEDVFIHHHLSASFNKLKQQKRKKLFEDNKKIYEAKWGVWIPHTYRNHESSVESQSEIVPDVFAGQKYITGHCVVCGKDSQFFYQDVALWRESLNCQHCRSTSRYRSIARGLLRAINELTGLKVSSLATLPHTSNKKLSVYDTQTPFYYESCAYPLPDLLKASGWINVKLSQFKPKRKLGEVISQGVTNQNLECLTLPDASLDILITSDVMEHVRLDDRAHREIYRVLKPGGIYLFTVPHNRSWEKNLTRVQVTDPNDSSKDVYLLEPEYHGDANSDDGGGVLAYRAYGKELEVFLNSLGFEVRYEREDIPSSGVMNTELYYCRKTVC